MAWKTVAVIVLALMIAGCGLLVWATGGIKYVYAHLMYVPIVLAALTFGIRGGIAAALVGGLVLGPFMPLDTATGQVQVFGNWFFRLMSFSFIGLITGTATSAYRRQIRNGLRWNARLSKKTRELSATNAQLLSAQQQLARQERLHALGEMASGISHDFNNALTPVTGYAELLAEHPKIASDPETVRAYARDILLAGRDAAEIVSRLKGFYREKDEREQFSRIDLAKAVGEAIRLTHPRWKSEAEGRGVSIHLVEDLTTVPEIPVIESELRQALVNLIFNAVDAMPEGGTLTVRCGSGCKPVSVADDAHVEFGLPPSPFACIEISDTGIGMDVATLQRCVEPFFTTKGERGTGLGLATVFGTVRRHDGQIAVFSREGEGTLVRLLLPSAPIEAKTHRSDPEPHVSATQRILVVDDETPVRSFLMAALESDGHSVQGAVDGKQALAIMDEEPVDVVIADHGMPGVPGPELAGRIRHSHPRTRIILCSGNPGCIDRGKEAAAIDRYLHKPVGLDDLRRTLQELSG